MYDGPVSVLQIRDFVADAYDEEGLRTLADDLGYQYGNIQGSTVDGKARELVRKVEREGRLIDLLLTIGWTMSAPVFPNAWESREEMEAGEKLANIWMSWAYANAHTDLHGQLNGLGKEYSELKWQRDAYKKQQLMANAQSRISFIDQWFSQHGIGQPTSPPPPPTQDDENVYSLFLAAYNKLSTKQNGQTVKVNGLYGRNYTVYVLAAKSSIRLSEEPGKPATELNVFSTYETTLEAGYMFNTVNLLKAVIELQ